MQTGNLIPIESEHARAAERGENRAHSGSVLKFQEAEVDVLATYKSDKTLPCASTLSSFSLVFSIYPSFCLSLSLFMTTLREKFIDVDRRQVQR